MNKKGPFGIAFIFLGYLALFGPCSLGQDGPRIEISGSYSFLSSDVPVQYAASGNSSALSSVLGFTSMGDMHGWNAAVSVHVSPRWRLVADVAGHYAPRQRFESYAINGGFSEAYRLSGSQYTLLFGPRFSFNSDGRIKPFVQGLAGVSRLARSMTGSFTVSGLEPDEVRFTGMNYTESALVVSAGAGLDIRLQRRWSLRVAQVDYALGHRTLEPEIQYVPHGSTMPTVLTYHAPGFLHRTLRFSYGVVFLF